MSENEVKEIAERITLTENHYHATGSVLTALFYIKIWVTVDVENHKELGNTYEGNGGGKGEWDFKSNLT